MDGQHALLCQCLFSIVDGFVEVMAVMLDLSQTDILEGGILFRKETALIVDGL